ncbi:MAG: YidB family protein [Rhodomicrobium sp.]
MGIFDTISGAIGEAMRQRRATAPGEQPDQASASGFPGGFSNLLAGAGYGNLSVIVQRLSAGGLQEEVASWLGSGSNLPVSAEQLRSALGNQEVQRIAQQFGLPADRILQILSQHLPAAVDQASPNGKLEQPDQGTQ